MNRLYPSVSVMLAGNTGEPINCCECFHSYLSKISAAPSRLSVKTANHSKGSQGNGAEFTDCLDHAARVASKPAIVNSVFLLTRNDCENILLAYQPKPFPDRALHGDTPEWIKEHMLANSKSWHDGQSFAVLGPGANGHDSPSVVLGGFLGPVRALLLDRGSDGQVRGQGHPAAAELGRGVYGNQALTG